MKPVSNKILFVSMAFELVVLLGSILGVLFYPVPHVVEGRIEDWLPNDNGFGLKIDGQVYWLSYDFRYSTTGRGSEHSLLIPFGSQIVGRLCVLEYYGTISFPRGTVPFYARTIHLTVIGGGWES